MGVFKIPEYSFRCRKCNITFRELTTIANRNKLITCECGGAAKRDVDAELAYSGKGVKWVTENERWSTSMGVPAEQVGEFRKRFPNSVYRDDGRLLIRDRKDKKRQMKERGMAETNDLQSKAWFR